MSGLIWLAIGGSALWYHHHLIFSTLTLDFPQFQHFIGISTRKNDQYIHILVDNYHYNYHFNLLNTYFRAKISQRVSICLSLTIFLFTFQSCSIFQSIWLEGFSYGHICPHFEIFALYIFRSFNIVSFMHFIGISTRINDQYIHILGDNYHALWEFISGSACWTTWIKLRIIMQWRASQQFMVYLWSIEIVSSFVI